MNYKFPFQINLEKLNLPYTLEEIDGYITDYENGEKKIKLFKGSHNTVLIVKDKKIFDSSNRIKIGEYL